MTLDFILEKRKGVKQIPQTIGDLTQEVLITSGNKPEYLLDLAQEYELTSKEMEELSVMRTEFETSFPTFRRMLEEGYRIDNIRDVFNIRNDLTVYFSSGDVASGLKEREPRVPSLTKIMKLYDTFGVQGLDYEALAENINELGRIWPRIQETGVNSFLIDKVVDYAKLRGIENLSEAVDDLIESKTRIYNDKADNMTRWNHTAWNSY